MFVYIECVIYMRLYWFYVLFRRERRV